MYKVFSSPALKDSNGILQKDLTGVAVKEVNLSLRLYLRVFRSMLWSVLSIVNFNVRTYTAFSSIQVIVYRFSLHLNSANRTSVRSFTNKNKLYIVSMRHYRNTNYHNHQRECCLTLWFILASFLHGLIIKSLSSYGLVSSCFFIKS